MPSYILIGEEVDANTYVDLYINKNSIEKYNVYKFKDKVLIESARSVIKLLSQLSSSKRLFLIENGMTIESQNSLLKNLEELDENNSVFIYARTKGEILPTIQSRSFVVNLGSKNLGESELKDLIKMYLTKDISIWELVDSIESDNRVKEKGYLESQFRISLLDLYEFCPDKMYLFLKRYFYIMPLVENNNINIRVGIEKIFRF